MVVFLTVGILLRLALYIATPLKTFYGDHVEPIFYFMHDGEPPPKNAGRECNQPPAFCVTSALAGKVAVSSGANPDVLLKFLQPILVVYGILTLPVIYLILLRFPLPAFARILVPPLYCKHTADLLLQPTHGPEHE